MSPRSREGRRSWKAWRLTAPGGELSFREVPDPVVTDGSVLVRLQAAPLLSYLRSYVHGQLPGYRPPQGEPRPVPTASASSRQSAPECTACPPASGCSVPRTWWSARTWPSLPRR